MHIHILIYAFFLSVLYSRNQLCKANFDTPPMSPKTPASAVKCKTPRERAQKCNSTVLSHFFQKRPKTSPSKETWQDSSVAQSVQRVKIETARTHSANSADLHLLTAQRPQAVKEEPMDEEEACIQGSMAVKQESAVISSPPSRQCKTESWSPSEDVKPVIKGEANCYHN